MPFGFERQLQRENEAHEQLQTSRKFIVAAVTFKPDGKIIPKSFIWNDCEYKIDKVLNCVQGNSLKDSVLGLRYECMLRNKRFFLYFTGEKWYFDI